MPPIDSMVVFFSLQPLTLSRYLTSSDIYIHCLIVYYNRARIFILRFAICNVYFVRTKIGTWIDDAQRKMHKFDNGYRNCEPKILHKIVNYSKEATFLCRYRWNMPLNVLQKIHTMMICENKTISKIYWFQQRESES